MADYPTGVPGSYASDPGFEGSIPPQVPADVVNLWPEELHSKLDILWRGRDLTGVVWARSTNHCCRCRKEFHENVHRSKADNVYGGYYSSKGPHALKHFGLCERCMDELLELNENDLAQPNPPKTDDVGSYTDMPPENWPEGGYTEPTPDPVP